MLLVGIVALAPGTLPIESASYSTKPSAGASMPASGLGGDAPASK